MKHTIDATGKKLGRVASEAAQFLMGKNTPAFRKNIVADNEVEIINVSKAEISDKKIADKFYEEFSGYPGGLNRNAMKRVIEKQGLSEVFERAVYGMLPTNKLRSQMIKKLTISE